MPSYYMSNGDADASAGGSAVAAAGSLASGVFVADLSFLAALAASAPRLARISSKRLR